MPGLEFPYPVAMMFPDSFRPASRPGWGAPAATSFLCADENPFEPFEQQTYLLQKLIALHRARQRSDASLRSEVASLKARVAHLESRLDRKPLWDVGELVKRIDEIGAERSLDLRDLQLCHTLVRRLHDIAVDASLEALPPPQVVSCSDATVEFVWVYPRKARLSFTVIPRDDEEEPGSVWMSTLTDESPWQDVYNPSNTRILDELAAVLAW